MSRLCVVTAAAVLVCVGAAAAHAQQAVASDSVPRSTLSVYVDCEDWQGCDFDYFRTEMTFVNWVRDRQVADVHILVTTQQTGAGGREYTVTFLGLRAFAGLTDTLKYVALPATTQDDRRRALAAVFRAGLVRYVARTPDVARLVIRVGDSTGAPAAPGAPGHDRWHTWVFNTNVNGWSNGEKTYHALQSWGSVNADRVTPRWKTHVSLENSYNESTYDIDSVTTFTNIQRGYGANALHVKSLGEHWSAGVRASATSSTYDNFRRVLRLTPALEYDVFPYSQSTRQQLRIEYNIGVAAYAYNDTTIFDRTRETIPVHNLLVSVATRETWGSIDLGVSGNGYLNDRTKYRLGSFTQLSLRLFRGLSLQAYGSYTVIRDQFALAKKDFTPEEILTRQFQRATTYRYFGNIGLGYTFGSIFNNVVNPRMATNYFD